MSVASHTHYFRSWGRCAEDESSLAHFHSRYAAVGLSAAILFPVFSERRDVRSSGAASPLVVSPRAARERDPDIVIVVVGYCFINRFCGETFTE